MDNVDAGAASDGLEGDDGIARDTKVSRRSMILSSGERACRAGCVSLGEDIVERRELDLVKMGIEFRKFEKGESVDEERTNSTT